ncbi:MAG: protein-glutamate O-methyltransferase CheR [Terracidiphilus sp.]
MATVATNIEIHPENYKYLQQSVYSEVGIVLEDNKHYLLEGRLLPLAAKLGLGSVNDLCRSLRQSANAETTRMIAEAMTTNETYFFREPQHYDAIKNLLLPRLKADVGQARKLRFWSAAASTGQEAYSLAMLMLEQGLDSSRIQIQGTDFSSKVVERARSGLYHQIEVNRGLPTSLLLKYFHRAGVNWQLNENAMRMASFDTFDLRSSMRTMGPFDMAFCRNVMIYFDNDTKRKMIKEIHSTLFRGGWFLVGSAETPPGLNEYFEEQRIGSTTIYVAR